MTPDPLSIARSDPSVLSMRGVIWYGDLASLEGAFADKGRLLAAALRLMPTPLPPLPWGERAPGVAEFVDPGPARLTTAEVLEELPAPSRGRYWRLVEREVLTKRPKRSPKPEGLPRPVTPQWTPQAAPREPLLAPEARLLRLLEERLRNPRPADLDVARFVGEFARLRIPQRPFRRPRLGWAPRVLVLLDQSPETRMLLDADQGVLRRTLVRKRGIHGLRFLAFRCAPTTADLDWCLARLEPGTVVFHFGALGHYAGTGAAWGEFGRGLIRGGHALAALLAVPRGRWDAELTQLWNAESLEAEGTPVPDQSAGARRERASALLRLLCPAVRVEPGLLREVRRLLPDGDVGTEADAWAHSAFSGLSAAAGTLNEHWAATERRRLRDHPDPALVARSATLRRRWRGHLPPSIGAEEDRSMAAARAPGVSREEERAAREVFLGWARALEASVLTEVDQELLLATVRRTLGRVDDSFWDLAGSDEELVEAMRLLLTHTLRRFPDAPMPEGLGPADLDAPDPEAVVQTTELWQVGNHVRAVTDPRGPTCGAARVGTPLARIERVRPVLRLGLRRGSGRPFPLDTGGPEEEHAIPRGASLSIESDCERLVFERVIPPRWARRFGWDRYGLWAELDVPDVRYVLRWIPPGRFLQGSPPSELGRVPYREVQREVTLSRGYWLGETPVTQKFWETVMGTNPSTFVSDLRPVESVNVADCEGFLARLRTTQLKDKGFHGELPTEAQWEYACRAGTTTSTYVGDLGHDDEIDAALLESIAWFGSDSGGSSEFEFEPDFVDSQGDRPRSGAESGTQLVRGKLPNAWGLFDMLGNVWEWCRDEVEFRWRGTSYWISPYLAGPARNPLARGGTYRIVRGGSWRTPGPVVRAASRSADAPGDRNASLGFRLSEDGS